MSWGVKLKVTQSCPTLCDPMEYSPWSSPGLNTGVGSPFPSPGPLPNPEIEPRSPTLQANSLPTELSGKPEQGLGVQFNSFYGSFFFFCKV